jgi:hypothetical protein
MTDTTICTTYQDVDPDLAMKWLEGNVHNRKIDQKWVDYLAAEMTAGRWKTTHQGIAFDGSGTLIDGQHRLWAVIQSGCTIHVAVTHGLRIEDIDNIDDNHPRSKATRMTLTRQFGSQGVSKNHVATLSEAIAGLNGSCSLTYHQLRDQMEQHVDAARYAVSHVSGKVKGIGVAYVRAVVLRAWYSVDLDMLERFCRVLSSGIPESSDDAAIIRLRDQLITVGGVKNPILRRELYAKVERVLTAWLKGENRTVIRPVLQEYFPFPEEV